MIYTDSRTEIRLDDFKIVVSNTTTRADLYHTGGSDSTLLTSYSKNSSKLDDLLMALTKAKELLNK